MSMRIALEKTNYDKVKRVSGMNINVVTSAQNNHEAYKLLMAFGMPIKENKKLESIEN